jgi:simple sugar transport system substrate-binding protein
MEHDISRRSALTTAAKLGLGAAGFAGGIGTALGQSEGAGLPKKNYKFFFVCHVTLDQFFTPTRYGAQDACAAFGCSYQWTGSEKNVVSEMVSAMQTAIAEKADGIAVCLVDPKAFDAATDQAVAAAFRSSPSTPMCRPAAPTNGRPMLGNRCSSLAITPAPNGWR